MDVLLCCIFQVLMAESQNSCGGLFHFGHLISKFDSWLDLYCMTLWPVDTSKIG